MPNPKLMRLGGLAGALTGLPYLFGFFGLAEREMRLWGLFCLGLGFGLMALSTWTTQHKNLMLVRLMALGFALLAVLQLLPVQLWFAFYGYALSDSSPPGPAAAQWAYALPHLVVLALSLAALYQLCHQLLTE
jgi:hypothetical protein